MIDRRSARITAVVVSVAITQLVTHAEAQSEDLVLTTREHGDWGATVARLQTDLRAEGSVIHIVVGDHDGARSACGRYALSLDDPGARAFRVGRCDPGTDETEVWLVSRDALFTHDGGLARPRAIAIAATVVHVGRAMGGASLSGGSAIDCALSIHPYAYDLETGRPVMLSPERYEVVTRDRHVTASAELPEAGPMASHEGSTTIDFDVVDRVTGEIVLRDRAILACRSGAPSPPIAPQPPALAPQPPLAQQPHSRDPGRVQLYRARDDLRRPAEVVGLIDVQEPSGTETGAMQQLRDHAAAMGADAVVGVEWQPGRGETHLSGIAVRFVATYDGETRNEAPSARTSVPTRLPSSAVVLPIAGRPERISSAR